MSASLCLSLRLSFLFIFLPLFYYGELERCLSISPLIRCCQPASRGGTRGLSKTLLINKPPMHPLPAFTALAHLPQKAPREEKLHYHQAEWIPLLSLMAMNRCARCACERVSHQKRKRKTPTKTKKQGAYTQSSSFQLQFFSPPPLLFLESVSLVLV